MKVTGSTSMYTLTTSAERTRMLLACSIIAWSLAQK
nr:MAG TPA: hypothetical protein [Caudoviricetes sp.]